MCKEMRKCDPHREESRQQKQFETAQTLFSADKDIIAAIINMFKE